MFTISGGICQGYRINQGDEKLALHFTQMHDAILVRDRLNSRAWKLADWFSMVTA